MRFRHVLLAIAALAALGASGCSTTLTVVGYPAADVFVTIPAGAKDYTLIGRTAGVDECRLVYELPGQLENAKVGVRVRTKEGIWNYTVFTDRDVTLHYPPEGFVPQPVAKEAPKATRPAQPIAARKPVAPAPPPAPPAVSEPAPTTSDGGLLPPPADPDMPPPSATVSPE